MENLFIKYTESIVYAGLILFGVVTVLGLFVEHPKELEPIKKSLYHTVVMLTLIFIYLRS